MSFPKRLLTITAFATLAGCDAAPSTGDFSLFYDRAEADGGPMLFNGTSVACSINTSFPASDPRSGKFFTSVIADQTIGSLLLTAHFLEHADAPPSGTYTIPSQLTVSAVVKPAGEAQVDISPTTGTASVTLSDDGDLKITLPAGQPLHGTIACSP